MRPGLRMFTGNKAGVKPRGSLHQNRRLPHHRGRGKALFHVNFDVFAIFFIDGVDNFTGHAGAQCGH